MEEAMEREIAAKIKILSRQLTGPKLKESTFEELENLLEEFKETAIEAELIIKRFQDREMERLELKKIANQGLKLFHGLKQLLKSAEIAVIELTKESNKVEKVCEELIMKFEVQQKEDYISKTWLSLYKLQKHKPFKRNYETNIGIRDLIFSIKEDKAAIEYKILIFDAIKAQVKADKTLIAEALEKTKFAIVSVKCCERIILTLQIKLIDENLAKTESGDLQDLLNKKSALIKKRDALETEIKTFCNQLKTPDKEPDQSEEKLNQFEKQNNWKDRAIGCFQTIQQSKISVRSIVVTFWIFVLLHFCFK